MTPHLDYGDISYDQLNNESFTQKIEYDQPNNESFTQTIERMLLLQLQVPPKEQY